MEGGKAISKSRLEALKRIGDDGADGVVERIAAAGGGDGASQGAALEDVLKALLRWRPESGVPLGQRDADAFLASDEPLPEWFKPQTDWARVRAAQEFFQKFQLTAVVVLGCASLPLCYVDQEIATTLTVSGLLGLQVRRRVSDTSDFVMAVMKPGALEGAGPGVRWVRKVRLMHAIMRRLTLLDPAPFATRAGLSLGGFLLKRKWRRADAMPIDQVELVYVLLTFSLAVIDGWKSLRIMPSTKAQEDYLLTWSLVGHMLGIREELLAAARSRRDARRLFADIAATVEGTEKGRLLTATLTVLLADSVLNAPAMPWLMRIVRPWADPILLSLPRTLIRRLVGKRTARQLWVDEVPLFHRIVHWALIEVIGFGDLVQTTAGRDISETGFWRGLGSKFKQDCDEVARAAR
jgi:mpaB/rubber oxygenase-like protein